MNADNTNPYNLNSGDNNNPVPTDATDGNYNQYANNDFYANQTSYNNAYDPSNPANVVVSSQGAGNGIPKWFFIVFAITLIAFFAVTILLITSIAKPNNQTPKNQITPSPASTTIVPTTAITPTVFIIPSPTPDKVILDLNQRSPSDEIGDIDSEITTTDLSGISETLKQLDNKISSSK